MIRHLIYIILITLLLSKQVFCEFNLTIIYTNDEHGWIEADKKHNGVSNLKAYWDEINKSEKNVIILSGGDNYAAGPPLTIHTKGQSTSEVMNKMGYTVAALGNHEFDFGLEQIEINSKLLGYKFLAANIYQKSSMQHPNFSIPYIIKEVGGKKIGIIGLTNKDTPTLTNPKLFKDIEFKDYKESLLKFLPELKKKSDIILLLIHDCSDYIRYNDQILNIAKSYKIPFIGTGHCHRINNIDTLGMIILEAGSEFKKFGKVNLTFDDNNEVISYKSEILDNKYKNNQSEDITKILEKYQQEFKNQKDKLREIIGYIDRDLTRESGELHKLIFDAWFENYPQAEISFFNKGSVRDDLKKGNISYETIKSIMPFENNLYLMEISGKNLKNVLENRSIVIYQNVNGKSLRINDISSLNDKKTYKLIIPDFLYYGGDKIKIKEYCKEFIDLEVNYSTPVINYFINKYKK